MNNPFTRDVSEELKYVLGVAMIAWIVARQGVMYLALKNGKTQSINLIKKISVALLIPIALVSFMGYSRMIDSSGRFSMAGFRYIWTERVDSYDLIHYYLTPKYFDELSYFRLYPAVITADLENGGPFFKLAPSRKFIVFQDSKDYFWANSKEFMRDTKWQAESKALFSQKRWEEFSHDFLYLQRSIPGGMDTGTWNDMLWDHGFNGTPAWVGTIKWLVNLVPIEEIKKLCYVDVALLAASFCVTWWAFGIAPALVYFIFYFTTYSSRWPTLSWAFGRYDYLSFLVICLGFLKREKFVLAGIFGSWAACIRIFPALWFIGPTMRWWNQPSERTKLSKIFLSAALLAAILWGNALAQVGFDDIQQYFRKMHAHTSIRNLSSMREGFALALAYEGNTHTQRINKSRRDRIEEQTPLRVVLTALTVICFLICVRRLPPYESYAYGFIPFFMIFTASYYYYVVRAPLFIMHAFGLDSEQKPARLRHSLGLIYLFGVDVLSNYLATEYPLLRVMQVGMLGWALTGYVFLQLLMLAREQRQAHLCERASLFSLKFPFAKTL